MRDIEVDKERNIVFARVGKRNCKSITYFARRDLDTGGSF